MVTIKCQHSGIEFDAKTSRTKQHPFVAAFKNTMARDYYRQACEALDEAAEQEYSSIEEYMKIVKSIAREKIDAKNGAETARRRAQKERESARREAKAERDRVNAHLRKHGYIWHKDPDDGYQPVYGFGDSQWHLMSPDHYEVTVAQALKEIERGVDGVVAERAAARAAEEKAAEEKAAAEEAEMDALQEARKSVMANAHEVEEFGDDEFETIYERRTYSPSTIINIVRTGQINGVSCGTVYRYSSSLGEDKRYWCDNPARAGLVKLQQNELEAAFSRLFGA